jgi:hypothetical protein
MAYGDKPMEFGDKIDEARMTKGVPPLVMQVQPSGFIPLEKPEEIKAFESMMQAVYGKRLDVARTGLHACETCSAGCTDDCGMMF